MPSLTIAGYTLVGITAIMGIVLIALLVSLVRMSKLSRTANDNRAETTMMSAALQEALTRLKGQERAMAARAEASERLSNQIITGVGAGLIVVNRHGLVQIVNPAARRILNIDADGSGQPIETLLRHVAPLAQAISDTLRSGVPVARRKLRLDGRPSYLGVSVSPLAGPDRELQAAVCLFTDLTEVVELEEQLRLKEALAGVGELTAGLAHEFRNGLATIHGYARLVDLTKLPEAYRPYVEGIRMETNAMGEVVTNFLNFARPEPLALAPVDLRAIVERAAADLPLERGRIEVDGEFGEVLGDEVLLRQAVSNLIRNSVEACSAADIEPEVRVEGAVDAAHIRITVEDNGPGIPSEALSRIFRPFVTTKTDGSGLGLAIVQKVIVSHNGRVTADNRPEGGARFRIQLPPAGALR
jgi:two-component system, NtrC family, nitrogen regulation sensor histidine kinase GlnL